jgi:N-acetylmuramoyl-L-alanine amidase
VIKIYISPSTQENNIGAGSYGTEEARMNQLADILCELLAYNGFEVRRNRPEMTLSQVVSDSDAWKPDIHVALHSNATGGKPTARGCVVFGYLIDGRVTNSERLSKFIYDELSNVTPTSDRGVKDGEAERFAEIVKVDATSTLIEHFFHDNIDDVLFFLSHMYDFAVADLRGICKYFNIECRLPDKIDYKAKYEALLKDIETLMNKYKGA